MRRLRSVGVQLLAALLAVVVIALATTYLMVVPTLNSNLVSDRLNELQHAGYNMVYGVVTLSESYSLQGYVGTQAAAVSGRIIVFQSLGSPPELGIKADSLINDTEAIGKDKIALAAARSGVLTRGTVTRGDVLRAEVAIPVTSSSLVILLSSPLTSVKLTVSSVRRELLVAAFPSLVLALALGFLGARGLSQRVKRLQRAADRIAAGEFGEPFVDAGADEIGELASSFERMRQRLSQLDEARREFIANASHELRTPIFALSGSLELLAEEEMDDASRDDFLETMRGQVDRLHKLASALLDLSRLDAGLDLSPESFSLEEAAISLTKEFEAAAELSGHPLSVSLDGKPIVHADEQKTLQIGRILLENALLHTPADVKVSISTGRRDATGTLTVEDAGQGIPEDDQERVFERFFRLEGERSSGSGLGLAIAREWATRMGGTLTLESRPGSTRFSLELPLSEDPP